MEADTSLEVIYKSLLCGWIALSACGCERGGMTSCLEDPLGVFCRERNKAMTPAKMFLNAHILSTFMHAKNDPCTGRT
jgi:hypothetical protein